MNRNVKIAKELVRLARNMVSMSRVVNDPSWCFEEEIDAVEDALNGAVDRAAFPKGRVSIDGHAFNVDGSGSLTHGGTIKWHYALPYKYNPFPESGKVKPEECAVDIYFAVNADPPSVFFKDDAVESHQWSFWYEILDAQGRCYSKSRKHVQNIYLYSGTDEVEEEPMAVKDAFVKCVAEPLIADLQALDGQVNPLD